MTEGNGAAAHLLGRREQGRRRQVDDDGGDARPPARAREQGGPRRVRHLEPGRLEGVPGAGRDGAHQPRRGGRLDPPRQHVRPAPRRGRGDQHGGAQQPRGQAVRTHARQQPGGAREPARGALGDQPAARQPGASARVHRRRSRRRRCTSCATATSATRRSSSSTTASKIREEVEGRGGKSITLPDLADRVADDIYCQAHLAERGGQGAPHRQPRGARDGGAGRCARSSPESCRRERRGDVREGRRATRLGRGAAAPLPAARRARPARQRRVLEHRDGARVLRLVLPAIPGRARGAHRALHRGRTRGLRGGGRARGRAGAADALGEGRGDERRDRAASSPRDRSAFTG